MSIISSVHLFLYGLIEEAHNTKKAKEGIDLKINRLLFQLFIKSAYYLVRFLFDKATFSSAP